MAATIDENNRPAVGAFNPERFGRLESDVEYIKRDVAELKGQVKELRTEMAGVRTEIAGVRTEMAGEFKSVRAEARTDFRWLISLLLGLIGLMLAGFGGILSAVAKGFHWVG